MFVIDFCMLCFNFCIFLLYTSCLNMKQNIADEPRSVLPERMGMYLLEKTKSSGGWLRESELHKEQQKAQSFFPPYCWVMAKTVKWGVLLMGVLLGLPDPLGCLFKSVRLIKRKRSATLILYRHVSLLYYLISDRQVQAWTNLLLAWSLGCNMPKSSI